MLFNLLSTYCILGTVLDSKDIAMMNKQTKILVFVEFTICIFASQPYHMVITVSIYPIRRVKLRKFS